MPSELTPQSIELFAGKAKTIIVTVTDDDGNAVDLTGGTAAMYVARTLYDAPVISANAVLTDPPAGVLSVELDDTDTDDLIGTYYYEVEFTDSLGNEEVVTFGYLTVRPALSP